MTFCLANVFVQTEKYLLNDPKFFFYQTLAFFAKLLPISATQKAFKIILYV